jgi:hypothetical protein
MILELFNNILYNTFLYNNNMKGGMQSQMSAMNYMPAQQNTMTSSAMSPPISRSNSNLNFRQPSLPNNLSATSIPSPDGGMSFNDPNNDGMSDEMGGLCILLLIVIFGIVIAIWLYTEKRVLKKDIKSRVKSETKPEVVSITK